MEIYRIANDFSFKNLSGKDGVTGKFFHYKGQKLADTWEQPSFALVEDVATRKSEIALERKLDKNFDARYYGHIFLIKESFVSSLQNLHAEFLPVALEGVEEKFVFVNILNIVEAIDFNGLDYHQSMAMLKSDKIRFLKKNIGAHIAFRDQKLINNYYFTTPFIENVTKLNIKGLRFEKAGEAV